MRHIVDEFDVFTFDELDEQAQERARDWYRSCMDEHDWNANEWHKSLEAFVDLFNGKLRDWSYPERGRSYVKVDWHHDDCILELSGVRLWKYLRVNYGGSITVSDGGTVGSADNPYRSHKEKRDGHDWILYAADGGCTLTGWYTDCALFSPLAEFIKRPDRRSFDELLYECLESFLCAAADAYEDCGSDETVDENIRANEYEFTEDGEHYQ